MTLQHQQQISSKTTTEKEIETGLDFILSHFEQPIIFPRTVMAAELLTIDQKKYQRFKLTYSREEALTHFKKYNFVDCRINAFPSLKEGVTWQPNLIFIDLDLADFNSTKSLQIALNKTRKNIEEKLNGFPTILGSGNGYHIIQPVECPILEQIEQFQKYGNKPSEQFLRFAKDFLSNGKADQNNYPSFRSCLLRIPGSINGKCLNDRDKRLSGNFRVKILQKWNGVRPNIPRELLYDFHTYLNQKKSNERRLRYSNKIRSKNNKKYHSSNNNNNNNNYYDWIETKVLQTAFSDYRKLIVGLILAPYLVVIKKLSYDESFKIIYEWLQKCDSSSGRKLDFDPKYLINNNIKSSVKKLIPPISIYKLEVNYRNLYLLLLDQNNNNNNINNNIVSLSNQTERERVV